MFIDLHKATDRSASFLKKGYSRQCPRAVDVIFIVYVYCVNKTISVTLLTVVDTVVCCPVSRTAVLLRIELFWHVTLLYRVSVFPDV